MKVTVGNRNLIGTVNLHVPAGESAWIEFSADSWHVKLNIRFIDDPKIDPGFTIEPSDDHAIVTFKNWNQSLPAATTQPQKFGEKDGKALSFILSGYAVEGLKVMTLSFFKEQ